jgi:hypothetical protein
MRTASSILAASLCLIGCAGDRADEDGEQAPFPSGKSDGYELSEPEATAVMRLASTSTEAELRVAGVAARGASQIAAYRAGNDRQLGTADDQIFDSLAELDAVPYVGPRALESLLSDADQRQLLDEQGLGRHDVSILLPVPASGDLPWRAATPGKGGPLLPRAIFDQIGRSVFNSLDDAAEYGALRVIAVRFDPCFTVSLSSACQPQLRLVFQALQDDAHRDRGTHDGAVHALYNLTAEQRGDVIARLRALAAEAPQNRPYVPLGISPALAAQGMDGAYATGLGTLIADHAGASNLARMTFVTRTSSRQGQWELGGFHVRANAATGFPAPGPIQIIGDATLQVISNGGFGAGHRFSVSPGLVDERGFPGLDSARIPTLTATQQRTLQAWARDQESPRATVPDTTDCVSCHVAGHVSVALEAADPQLGSLDAGPRVIAGAEGAGDNMRAFGYFFNEPMISIRTANETAAVLRALDEAASSR